MLRILFDPLGDGHKDIFLKVDAMPSFVQVADSYYLTDFLAEDSKLAVHSQQLRRQFVQYLLRSVQNIRVPRFLPFDLSDNYVGGLVVGPSQKQLTRVQYGVTTSLSGFTVHHAVDYAQGKLNLQIGRDWLISTTSIVEGLTRSIQQLN